VAKYAEQNNYDLVIVNDWHTGPVASFLKQDARYAGVRKPKVIGAIHNLAYQGVFPKNLVDYLGLDWQNFNENGFEYHDHLNFLKGLLNDSDMVYTVSPNYAQEISTERFGERLDGVIRHLQNQYKLTGILNGIQVQDWDPSHKYGESIAHTFTPQDLSGKAAGKKLLQEHYHLPVNDKVPVVTLTSRLADQKGYEYLPGAIEEIVSKRNVQFVIVGDGDERYIGQLRALAARYPDKVHYEKFSKDAEQRLTAYSDFFVNASWFEPSGLNQFFAMKNGTIPIVTDVGGLRNSVQDGVTGFVSNVATSQGRYTHLDDTRSNLVGTLERALNVFDKEPEKITAMRRAGMMQDNSWAMRVEQFRRLFRYVTSDGPEKLTKGLKGKAPKAGASPEDLVQMLYEATRPPCHDIYKGNAA
jgi:starch synthase